MFEYNKCVYVRRVRTISLIDFECLVKDLIKSAINLSAKNNISIELKPKLKLKPNGKNPFTLLFQLVCR